MTTVVLFQKQCSPPPIASNQSICNSPSLPFTWLLSPIAPLNKPPCWTWPPSPSTSSCTQENNRDNPPQPSTPALRSAYKTCNSGLSNPASTSIPALSSTSHSPHLPLSCSPTKKGVRREVIDRKCSGHLHICLVLAISWRVIHLRTHHCTPLKLLNTVSVPSAQQHIMSHQITTSLQIAATILGPSLGLLPKHNSARSLYAGGTMALLCCCALSSTVTASASSAGGARTKCYATSTSKPSPSFAASQKKLTGGMYTLVPGQEVPATA